MADGMTERQIAEEKLSKELGFVIEEVAPNLWRKRWLDAGGISSARFPERQLWEALVARELAGTKVEGLRMAEEIARKWAESKSCDTHDENPCCHVRTGQGIFEAIRSERQKYGVVEGQSGGGMKTIEEVLQLWPGTEREKWHQHENGKGWVYETATVEATAYIGENSQVYGNSRVSGNAWVKPPFYIQGSRHSLTLCSYTEIAIGCHVRKISEWKKHYKAIGKAEGYTKEEVAEYGEYIELMAARSKKLISEAKAEKQA